jgi:diguanylate cyclase (GGDEF)-like protein
MNKKWMFLPVFSTLIISIISLFVFYNSVSSWVMSYESKKLNADLNAVKFQYLTNPPSLDTTELNLYFRNLPQASDQQRITIIRDDGVVIADTKRSLRQLKEEDNHKDRAEVIDALTSGYGESIHISNVTNIHMMYIAIPVNTKQFNGVFRISTPLSNLQSNINELMLWFGFILGLLLIFSTTSSFISQRIIQSEVVNEQEKQEARILKRTREIELLQRLANMLAACNNLSEAQKVVEDIVPRLLGNINGAISLIRSSRNQLTIELDWAGKWPASLSYAPEECWALRKGKFHLANDQYTHLSCEHMSEVDGEQALCIPLIAHSNTVGMMHLYFGKQEVIDSVKLLAFTVAEHIGLAVANLDLQDKLREQAVRDALTGLYNRRFFDECLSKEFMRANRHNTELSLLMLDLDHFKLFNDNFGHDAGDYVLKNVCDLILKNVRGEDTVCRIGGEELALFMGNSTAENATVKANELIDLIRDLNLELNGIALGKVTISIGIATYPSNGDDPISLVKLADTALYEAKDLGRDRCCHYNNIIESNTDEAKRTLVELKDEFRDDSLLKINS